MRELPRVSILVVDDRPENLAALEASLEPLGQDIVRAGSGDAALRAVLDHQFAVILMDIRMPGLDGFETIALLKQREKSRHIPIIFLSAYPEDTHAINSYASGAVDYLLKPFDPDVLRSKVSVFVSLRQNQLALEAAQAELERRVQMRTAQLEHEIRERKAIEQQLFDQAHHDGLTGLANRALLLEHLTQAIARSRRRAQPGFAVMLLDLDRFKHVNDTMGHLAGDALLVEVARRLQGCLREADMAARLGGDEFAILVEGVAERQDVTRLADRIQRALSAPYHIEGKEVLTSASIGIALMESRYQRPDELLRDADVAMYRAKETGRARSQVFDRLMHASIQQQHDLEVDLARAVERDELFLLYQPIVAVEDGRVVAFETLVRWRHPTRGIVLPDDFLALAASSGAMRELGRWVMTTACQQLAAWQAPAIALHVNVTPPQLAQPDLATEVETILAAAGIPPSRLRLDISETALLERRGVTDKNLGQLRALGVTFHLDDFGTGHSRLRDLAELPVSSIELHRSLLGQPALLRASVALARELGIAVRAEGVETTEQLARLKDLGCDFAQGHLLWSPLDATAAATVIPRASAGLRAG